MFFSGEVIHLLGVDLLDGTPVLDIKPYIPDYDAPVGSPIWQSDDPVIESSCHKTGADLNRHAVEKDSSSAEPDEFLPALVPDNASCSEIAHADDTTGACQLHDCGSSGASNPNQEAHCCDSDRMTVSVESVNSNSTNRAVLCADWVKNPPVTALCVTFTPRAEEQLKLFSAVAEEKPFRLQHLADANQLRSAIVRILSADPRSVYRRKHCSDRLYYVTVDAAHVTCWFDCQSVEVLRVQSQLNVSPYEQLG
jgi:tRNA (adenine37-N6)-methyltransferase